MDMRAVGGVAVTDASCTLADLPTTVVDTGPLVANTDMTVTGTVKVKPLTVCKDSTHLCVNSAPSGDPPFTDTNEPNNWHCIDISRRVSCDTG